MDVFIGGKWEEKKREIKFQFIVLKGEIFNSIQLENNIFLGVA